MMLLFQLFLSFLKIGFTSFGGLSMVPVISSEMISHGWMDVQEVSDIVAIAEMTPGPLGLNCATFAGIRAAGLPGAIVANLGALMPTLTVALCAAMFLRKFRENRWIGRMMTGIRPALIGLMSGLILQLSLSNYAIAGLVSIPAVVIGLLDFVLLWKYKASIPLVIAMSAGLGLVCFGVLEM